MVHQKLATLVSIVCDIFHLMFNILFDPFLQHRVFSYPHHTYNDDYKASTSEQDDTSSNKFDDIQKYDEI